MTSLPSSGDLSRKLGRVKPQLGTLSSAHSPSSQQRTWHSSQASLEPHSSHSPTHWISQLISHGSLHAASQSAQGSITRLYSGSLPTTKQTDESRFSWLQQQDWPLDSPWIVGRNRRTFGRRFEPRKFSGGRRWTLIVPWIGCGAWRAWKRMVGVPDCRTWSSRQQADRQQQQQQQQSPSSARSPWPAFSTQRAVRTGRF